MKRTQLYYENKAQNFNLKKAIYIMADTNNVILTSSKNTVLK